MRAYNERRNRHVVFLIERRKMEPKKVAIKLNLTIWNVYKIIHRYGTVQIIPNESIAQKQKVA